jgi:hypothetical protein
MLRVASVHQGVETTFVDMSYAKGEEVNEDHKDEHTQKNNQADDEEIVARVEAAIRPNTKVRSISFHILRCSS